MYINLVGWIAAALTTFCQLPQLFRILKRKHTKDISFATYSILGTGVFLWAVYGVFVKDIIIITANVVTFIIVFWIWLLKIKYG